MILYRLLAYLAFVGSFAALVLASTGLGLVPAIDGSARLGLPAALGVDLGLALLFAVQHTIMARRSFKQAFARVLPQAAERSTFVLASSICIAAIAFGWAPIEGDLWHLRGAAAAAVMAISFAGFALATASTFAFDHFELFGLRAPRGDARFGIPLLYRVVRHPMMLGILLGIWATPRMTIGHVVFAGALTAYVLVGVRYEERDLERVFGDDYARYRAEVPSLLPWPRPPQSQQRIGAS
jgi:protein-S-isoprenylcysteine O-methyltransferase Ste14